MGLNESVQRRGLLLKNVDSGKAVETIYVWKKDDRDKFVILMMLPLFSSHSVSVGTSKFARCLSQL